MELVDSGAIKPGKTLDLCCGAGTNPIYLAKRRFDVTALDISDKAVEYAQDMAHKAHVKLNLLTGSFLSLPFKNESFEFVFDFGCFHHVQEMDRKNLIKGVYRVLDPKGRYFLACFSYKNGPAWNHFRKEQIIALFSDYFEIEWIRHVSSLEADKVIRYFYEALMKRSAD